MATSLSAVFALFTFLISVAALDVATLAFTTSVAVTSRKRPYFKPHIEHSLTITALAPDVSVILLPLEDVGSIIESLLSHTDSLTTPSLAPVPTNSADAIQSNSIGPEIPPGRQSCPHLEASVTGFTDDGAGGSSTTIAPVETAVGMPISTSVVSGTTKYIVGSQTLAPGSPITVNDSPISINTSGGATVLTVGNKTTTIFSKPTDFEGNGAVATPGSLPSQSGKPSGAALSTRRLGFTWTLVLGAMVAMLGFD